jgi:hypothetical protein
VNHQRNRRDLDIKIDAEKDKLLGLIDFGRLAIQDPALDIGGLLYSFGESFTSQVLRYYDLYPTIPMLRRDYRWNLINFIEFILYGLRNSYKFWIDTGMKGVSNFLTNRPDLSI